MSHEDLRDCIDPIRTPAEQQISALQREVARLTTQAQHLAELHARMVRELVSDRDTLKRHLDAIAEALGLDKPKDEIIPCPSALCVFNNFGKMPTSEPNTLAAACLCYVQGKGAYRKPESAEPPSYLPDQLAEMVTALRQALEKISTWPPSYPCNQNIVRVMEHARAALDAGIKEK